MTCPAFGTPFGTPNKVKHMVSYFEVKEIHTIQTRPSRRRSSLTAMMNFTRRPWEHFPRRKSSASTNPRRTSSTSTGSESTTYDLAEEYLSESAYAASERSGTSTVISEDRRRSANPDYDWEHDDIADLKATLNRISLSSTPVGSLLTGSDTTNELHSVEPSGVESKRASSGKPGVHEIDFVELSASRAVEDESKSEPSKAKDLTLSETVDQIEVSHSETVKHKIEEGEGVTTPAAVDSKASEVGDSSQQFAEAKIPIRKSSASAVAKARQLRVKTAQSEKERKDADASSPSSPSPRSKTRPKLALDLPGIPESEAEALGRQRRPSLSMLQRFPSHQQAMHVNKSSRPPVSLKRYPVRSISAPLPGQHEPAASPREMMDLVNQRHVKFTNIREERLRRLSSINNPSDTSRPQSSKGLMGRRHASAPVSEAPPRKRKPVRRRSGMGPGMGRPSLAQRFSLSQRRQSFSQAIKEYIRLPRRRPSWLLKPSWGAAR